MIPRISWPWLFCFLAQNYILIITVSIVFASLGKGEGELYYNCQKNPLECTYGRNKYEVTSSASCSDRHPNCREYALRGNCIRNSQYMETQCPQSCGICQKEERQRLDQSTTTTICVDHHLQCPKWASEQECFINPPFINGMCPLSCIRCVNSSTTVLEHSEKEDDFSHNAEMEARIRYSQTDFGDWQTVPRDDINLLPAITEALFDMGEYAKELLEEEAERIRQQQQESSEIDNRRLGHPLLGPTAICNNIRHDCARLVAQHGCHGGYLEMMMQECSFACRFCHETYTYHQCRLSSKSNSGDRRLSLESSIITAPSSKTYGWKYVVWEHLSTEYGAVNLVAPTTSKFQNEWVASLNFSVVWKDTATRQKQRNELLQAAKAVFADDNEAAACMESTFQQNRRNRKRRKSMTRSESESDGSIATCNGPMNPSANNDKIDDATRRTSSLLSSSCQDLEQEMARLLAIRPEYLEPLEFLHFQNKIEKANGSTTRIYQRQAPMSEFDHHDQWRPSGHVLLTMLLVLQPAEKGGAIGFPDLDWLLATDPQILIWPTAETMHHSSSPTKAQDYHKEMSQMNSEILPVIQGDMYAIKIRARQYPYSYNPDCEN